MLLNDREKELVRPLNDAIAKRESELTTLRAINKELASALEESDGALTMLAEFTGAPDECDSDAFGLCGLPICEQVGCLCSKRDANRAALEAALEEQDG